METILNNLPEVLLALMTFIKVIVNLYPSKSKGAQVFGVIDTIVNAIIPDVKAGGGTHKKK